jgi:hypothetical protein
VPTSSVLRSAAIFCAAAITFAVSFRMLGEVARGDSPWLGLMLMFYSMGLAKIGGPLFVLRIPKVIRNVRDWETKGHAYNRLGVQRLGKLLIGSPLRFLNTSVYCGGQDLQSLYRQAASTEAIHFWAALLFMPHIALIWVRGHEGVAACFLSVQMLVNVYPILHLRRLRGRLDALFGKRYAKRSTPHMR